MGEVPLQAKVPVFIYYGSKPTWPPSIPFREGFVRMGLTATGPFCMQSCSSCLRVSKFRKVDVRLPG